MDNKIASLRRNYTKDGLLDDQVPIHPIILLKQWFEEALESKVMEPNAMTLSTVDKNGYPNSRMVLMKGIEDESIRFFTNYESVKGRELQNNPHVACVLWWGELERQIRIKGSVKKISEKESEEYFSIRPVESQLGAWASKQSRGVSGREELEVAFNEARIKFQNTTVPKPQNWGGYDILISEIEFWQGRLGRMHDRILFKKKIETWTKERLAP